MIRHPIYNITEHIDKPYYFGIGGLGDFLLLMSTFYDDINKDEVDVVFIANNMKTVQQLSSRSSTAHERSYFDKINKFWFFPRKAFPLIPELWDRLQEDPRLRGTGVTPKNFDYIGDWNECGKSDAFLYYGVKAPCKWAAKWGLQGRESLAVIQPFGGADDPTKVKQLSKTILKQLVNKKLKNYRIVFIGSPQDLEEMKAIGWDSRSEEKEITYCVDIKEAVNYIRFADEFYGADSWGKTLAGLAGQNRINVYKNKYIQRTPKEMFGQDTDPGDYVFLKNWNFRLLDDPEVI